MKCFVAAGDRVDAGCLVAESIDTADWYRCAHAPLDGVVTAIDHDNKNSEDDRLSARWLRLSMVGPTAFA